MKKQLVEKLDNKDAVICIVGLGYVGLPLVLRYSHVGFKVIGLDIDNNKVEMLNKGQSYIGHIDNDTVQQMLDNGFEATSDFSRASNVDALIICVPTPLGLYREPDLSFVIHTMEALQPYVKKGQIVSLESTTYPGTTEEELLPRLEAYGLKAGSDFFLVYSPEREDPGNLNFSIQTTPKVCGGQTSDCLEVGIALYRQVIDEIVPVSSTQTAELTKLLENIYRAVNIGLVNEMKVIADKMGIDVYEVIRAAATKPFGFVPYFPGPGLGGHCIPIDPFYLTWKAREFGVHTKFIELAGEVNSSMPDYVVSKVLLALNDRGKPLKGAKVLILGIAYKKNVDDSRESPAAVLMEKLQELDAEISYSDPHVPVFPEMREHSFDLQSVELTSKNLATYDCVVVATDHDSFDYELINQHAKLIVDCRGRYQNAAKNIVKA